MSTRLIETWLPIAELGIESVREHTPMTPFPAPNRLHVWWSRRLRRADTSKREPRSMR
jgi:putative DNA methylase